MLPVTFSCAGLTLSPDEAALFRQSDPFGFILFGRNIDHPAQVQALCADLRACVGRDCPILIDQEGGRVQRLRPPHWTHYPPAQACKSVNDVCTVNTAIAQDLKVCGIDVNCAPVMDVLQAETHDVIGDRAFSEDPSVVFEKALAACKAYLDQGVTPVIKHIPGHGRARVDSHKDLPVVTAERDDLEKTDFDPFRRISAEAIAPHIWGMVAHVVYTALDADHPATVSPRVVDIIRHDIGFNGLLLSDDVSMEALAAYGSVEDRCHSILAAGCDIALYCAGILDDMERIVSAALPTMRAESIDRYDRSRRAATTTL